MTLDSLGCFCAIVETGSFRAAAERVYRSQPAVSQRMKALERELGHTLIERRTGRPTALGRLLYGRARSILLSLESLRRELADFDEGAGGELRVGTSDTTALYVLPPCVRRFAERMPRTRLTIINRSSEAIVDQVLRGQLDLGIITLPFEHEELVEKKLFMQRLVLVTPARHPLARAGRVSLSALEGLPLLLLEADTRTGALLRDFFKRASFEPNALLDTGSFEVIKRFVAEGAGLSFLPETVITARDDDLAAVEVPGLPEIPIGAIWRKDAYRSKAERVFLDLLLAD